MDKIYIGIDPGKTGAVGVIDTATKSIAALPTGESIDLRNAILGGITRQIDTIPVVLMEHVHAFPKQGVTSTFSFGTNYGEWKALLQLNGYDNWESVVPRVWQKHFKIKPGLKQSKRKKILLKTALSRIKRYKKEGWTITTKELKLQEADALLIALYAYEIS